MSESDTSAENTTRECENLMCDAEATHTFFDDMGGETEVCDDCAGEFPEEMLEPGVTA